MFCSVYSWFIRILALYILTSNLLTALVWSVEIFSINNFMAIHAYNLGQYPMATILIKLLSTQIPIGPLNHSRFNLEEEIDEP